MLVIVVSSWLTPDGVLMHRRYDPFEAVNVIWVTWRAHPFRIASPRFGTDPVAARRSRVRPLSLSK